MALTPDIPGTELTAVSGAADLASAIGYFAIGISPIGVASLPPGTPGLPSIIPSYVFWQYSDDDNIQALVAAWNQLAQEYLNWFNEIGLPVYTGPLIFGALLDWIAEGLYGLVRPVLPSGTTQVLGPLGLLEPGIGPPLGVLDIVGPSSYYATDDDIFKRIITWHFFKGDGKVFSIRWLKRRIMRFLFGSDGAAPNIDQTYRVSVTFGIGNQVDIRIINVISTVIDGAIPGILEPGFDPPLGGLVAMDLTLPAIEYAQKLKDAIDYGALELPYAFTYVVTV